MSINYNYERLSTEQKELALKVEKLLVGLTVKEAQQLLDEVYSAVKQTVIS